MKIGLVSVDDHNFPSLPLMKLSAWHKDQGDTVEWYEPFKALTEGEYDKVYCSKVFSFTTDYQFPIYAKEIVKGGTGYCISLKDGREVFNKDQDNALPPPDRAYLSRLFNIRNNRYCIRLYVEGMCTGLSFLHCV